MGLTANAVNKTVWFGVYLVNQKRYIPVNLSNLMTSHNYGTRQFRILHPFLSYGLKQSRAY